MGSDEELQEVADLELQQQQPGGADADDEPASPSACTPRELAAMAAAFLNASLDLFGAAEAAGGFQTGANRCGRGGGPCKPCLWDAAKLQPLSAVTNCPRRLMPVQRRPSARPTPQPGPS